MTKNKKQIKDNNIDELRNKLILLREQIRVMRFKTQGSKPKNVKEEKGLKKQIAQILTKLNSNINYK